MASHCAFLLLPPPSMCSFLPFQAYFKDDSSNDLMTIDDDSLLRTIIVPEATFKSSMSRKSKGSTSRRRNSVSEVRSVTTQDDDDDLERRRESPIDEHSHSPPGQRGFPSPPLLPMSDAGSAFDFSLSANVSGLPWQSAQPTNDGNDSGSSAGTVTSPHGGAFFGGGQQQPQAGGYFGAGQQQQPLNRGRPMHLEGIHTRFDVAPALSFSSLSPSAMPVDGSALGRSTSLQTDWRSPFSANILGDAGVPQQTELDRRASLMSSRSTSSHSTSASSKLLGNGGGMSSSNSSSPASSWSQQSPYLNPVATPNNWPNFNSPLVPTSAPGQQQQQFGAAGGKKPNNATLPTHIAHHPDHVPSAVPPRRQTLPALYDAASYTASPTTWSPNPNTTSTTTGSYFSSTYPLDSNYYGSAEKPAQHHQHQLPELRHPHPVTATGVPGSWEESTKPHHPHQPSYDFSAGGVLGGGPVDLNSPSGSVLVHQHQQQYGEVFENALPATTATAHTNDYAWG